MPSSGYGIENLLPYDLGTDEGRKQFTLGAQAILSSAQYAIDSGLFVEWLESFVAAWNKTKDPLISAEAGLIEWDM